MKNVKDILRELKDIKDLMSPEALKLSEDLSMLLEKDEPVKRKVKKVKE